MPNIAVIGDIFIFKLYVNINLKQVYVMEEWQSGSINTVKDLSINSILNLDKYSRITYCIIGEYSSTTGV